MGYVVLLILFLLFTWLIYRNIFKSDLTKKDLLIGWSIKLLYAFIFMFLIAYQFGHNGQPMGDVGGFLKDSKIIQEYGAKNPGGYAKLMLGVNADNEQLLANELKETRLWDYGITQDNLNDNRLILRINSFIHFISLRNYWVHALIFAFLSFTGIVLIYRVFSNLIPRKRLFFIALLITPTFAFWGSGITKEALLVLSIGLYVFALNELLKKFKIIHLMVFLLAIILLILNKTHVGLVLIPMSAFIVVHKWISFSKKVFIGAFALIVILIFSFSLTPEKINLVDRLSYKQQDLINVAKGGVFFVNDSAFCAFDYSFVEHFDYHQQENQLTVLETTKGEYKLFGEKIFKPFTVQPDTTLYDVYVIMSPAETYVDVTPINHQAMQLVKNTPSALYNVLLRPLPGNKVLFFKYLLFIENLAFIGFILFTLFRKRRLDDNERRWVFYTFISALILILIIGWSTPIIGAVIRYKMAPQLLLLLAAFILWKAPDKSVQ